MDPEVFFFDWGNGHVFSCPETECFGALVEEHVHAVEGLAACFFGLTEKESLLGIIDDIGDYQAGAEERQVTDDGSVCVGSHSNGSSVEKEIAFGNGFF